MKLDINDEDLTRIQRSIAYYADAEFAYDDPMHKKALKELSQIIITQRYEQQAFDKRLEDVSAGCGTGKETDMDGLSSCCGGSCHS